MSSWGSQVNSNTRMHISQSGKLLSGLKQARRTRDRLCSQLITRCIVLKVGELPHEPPWKLCWDFRMLDHARWHAGARKEFYQADFCYLICWGLDMTGKKMETKIQQNSEDIKLNPALELFGQVDTTVHVSKILSLGAHVDNTSSSLACNISLSTKICIIMWINSNGSMSNATVQKFGVSRILFIGRNEYFFIQ